ncbi:hypothetical protein GCM10009804_60540 [Kribbella hippodromi]|uniref:CopG family transcriptional regulator n=2 Tax=Kribbella hippodromi TaxID=434347 RepID=A0ABP4PZ70_9ACTN
MQIYLPDDLYAEVKARKLRASELFQQAVRAEIRRQQLIDAADEWLAEQLAEHGEPSLDDLAWAEEFVAEMKSHLRPPDEESSGQIAVDTTRKVS